MQISPLSATTPLSPVRNDKEQTLEEFKAQFYKEIENITIHSSQSGTKQSITISDKGFEKMMADPAKKEEVLRLIRRELGAAYPTMAAPSFSTMNFDDNLEYTGAAYGSAYESDFRSSSANAFWRNDKTESASSRKKKADFQQLLDEAAEKRRAEKKREDELKSERAGEAAARDGAASSLLDVTA